MKETKNRRTPPLVAADVFQEAKSAPWGTAAKLRFRRTRIVATIGPASASPAVLKAVLSAGVDIARVNFSHGDPAEQVQRMKRIRRTAEACGRTVSILADLCGPKIRVGDFAGGQVTLRDGARVLITSRPVLGTERLIPSQYRRIAEDTKPGDHVLLDDGNLELRVGRRIRGDVEAEVVHGGVLKNHKGMNLPDSHLKVPALTAKDRSDVLYALRGDADFIALSFVRSARDVMDLKDLLRRRRSDTPVIAKIEKPEALDCIDDILAAADGIMVARGDLGVELPPQKVPIIQSSLIEKANRVYKPVIVATQMLESMIEHARPTRAEVTDVAMACFANADAVMLSAETASGRFPVEAVRTMDSILRETEAYEFFTQQGLFKDRTGFRRDDLLNALSVASAQISRDLKVRGISVLTRTGRTAQVVSADRPAAPIFALTHLARIARRVNLLWGVYPRLVSAELSFRKFVAQSQAMIKGLRIARVGDCIILLSGLTAPGNAATNSITIHRLT